MLNSPNFMAHNVNMLLCMLLLVSSCVGHMVLLTPVPYGNATLNNSPLDDTGSDFPCKQREGVYEVTRMNEWNIKDVQTIRFGGSAVHGGGSCQFSVTKDPHPTKGSQWKVIHSVVGGCPATAAGNLQDGERSATFQLVLPGGMSNGRYTFAWTWFNRSGDREMYMNCAPILVSGGTKNATFLDSLPDMFVANIPRAACATEDTFDFAFPHPGDSVQTDKQAKPATGLVGTGCETMTRLGAGAGIVMPAGKPDALRPSVLPHKPSALISSQVFKASGAAADTNTSPDTSITTITSQLPPGSPPRVACEQDGQIICIDSLHFGICYRHFAIVQALADGTSCVGSEIVMRGSQTLY